MEGNIGEIRLFAGNYAPTNWMKCEGQLLPINTNLPLFSIVGTAYGGDGRQTFGLPSLAAPAGLEDTGCYIICLAGTYPSRQ